MNVLVTSDACILEKSLYFFKITKTEYIISVYIIDDSIYLNSVKSWPLIIPNPSRRDLSRFWAETESDHVTKPLPNGLSEGPSAEIISSP